MNQLKLSLLLGMTLAGVLALSATDADAVTYLTRGVQEHCGIARNSKEAASFQNAVDLLASAIERLEFSVSPKRKRVQVLVACHGESNKTSDYVGAPEVAQNYEYEEEARVWIYFERMKEGSEGTFEFSTDNSDDPWGDGFAEVTPAQGTVYPLDEYDWSHR